MKKRQKDREKSKNLEENKEKEGRKEGEMYWIGKINQERVAKIKGMSEGDYWEEKEIKTDNDVGRFSWRKSLYIMKENVKNEKKTNR